MYTVIVDIRVVNTAGETVDHRGWPHTNPDRKFQALKTEQRFVTFEDVEKAQKALNGVHRLVEAAKNIV